MATRNKRKLAALYKENCEEHPRGNVTQNSAAPRSQEDYITQVSEEIEGRVTKKLSQEFSSTENRILGALARLDDFLMNPLLQGHSGNTPETSGNASKTNQGTNEDNPQSDPHPEASIFSSQTIRNSGQEPCCDTRKSSFFQHCRFNPLSWYGIQVQENVLSLRRQWNNLDSFATAFWLLRVKIIGRVFMQKRPKKSAFLVFWVFLWNDVLYLGTEVLIQTRLRGVST